MWYNADRSASDNNRSRQDTNETTRPFTLHID